MNNQPNLYEEEVNLEEMRRGLAVQAAVALGLTSVDDLLDAATKIEAYLSGDSKESNHTDSKDAEREAGLF